MFTKPKRIILHHSLTKDSETVSWNAIRRYHKSYAYQGKIIYKLAADKYKQKGYYVKYPWSDIGYHFGIELINDEYEILMGRMLTRSGAHTYGHNQDSIGICFVGNYDIIVPEERMLNLGVKLVVSLCTMFDIEVCNIHGHQHFANKTCPGTLFNLGHFKYDVKRALG